MPAAEPSSAAVRAATGSASVTRTAPPRYNATAESVRRLHTGKRDMTLASKLSNLFERYGGEGAAFALKEVLQSICPDESAMLELVDSVLQCVHKDAEGNISIDEGQLRSQPAPGRARIEHVLDILADDMNTVMTAVSELKDFPAAARGAVEDALANDGRAQKAAERVREATHKVFEVEQTQSRGEGGQTQGGEEEALVTGVPTGASGKLPRTVPMLKDPTLPPEQETSRLPAPPPPPAQDSPPLKAVLEVIAGPHAGRRFEFDRHQTFIAGRSSKVNLQLFEDAYFSRNHFLLEFNPPRCYLRDLGSSNGTLVNDRKVSECFLRDGDVISGGKTQIRYSLALVGAAPEAPMQTIDDLDLTHTHQEEPPRSVPGFDVLGPASQGALGVSRVAKRRADEKVFTLKFVRPSPPASETTIRQFIRDLAPLTRIEHPRLVRHHFTTTVDGWLCFLTDHVETFDLRQRLAGQPDRVLVQLCCATMCQALEGLAHAHAQEVFHGDVQPANVLVSNMGGYVVARIADLGLTRSLIDAGMGGMTYKGENPRDIRYLAPELITRPHDLDARADVYSASATLYHLLTGQPPHDFTRGKDPVAVILGESPVPIHHHRPSLPEPLAAVIHRGLAREPEARYPGVAELYMALRPFAS
jgi:hypothetical protein